MRIAKLLGAGIALLLFGNAAFSQQLKLGKNPFTIQKSAVLELNSDNQGLLLARISDTTSINSLSPPDGMVIYFTPSKQLMVRSNGAWQALTVTGGVISSLNGLTGTTQTFATGTTGTDFTILSSGTAHTFNIPSASATARGLMTTGAQTIAGAKSFTSAFNVTATNPLNLLGVQAGTSTTADSLLTITSGLVRKLPMSTFASAFTSGNLTETGSSVLTITGGTNAVLGSGATIQVKQASGAQNGFLSSSDWTTFNNKLSTIDTTNIANFYLKTRSLLSAGAGISYNAATGIIASTINTANFWTLGGNTVTTPKNIGTIDNNDLPFITNNSERMRIDASGKVGIGTNAPSTALHVVGTNPLTLTGVQAGTSTTADSLLTITSGLVRKIPMSTFATSTGITSLNGLTGGTQTFTTGTIGTDFTISSSGTAHTFNIPSASATARGLITTGAQTIAGSKTFSSAPLFSSLTAGSIPYIGAGGLLSQNNASLFWDATNNRLGLGTNGPASDFTLLQGTGGVSSRGIRLIGNAISGPNSGSGFSLVLGYNQLNNKQFWLGDPDYLGNSAGTFVRYSSSGGSTILDAVSGDNSVRRSTRIGVGGDPLSSVIFGDDNNSATPGSYVWNNGNMAIGNGYRSNSAPTNGLLVQGNVGIGTTSPSTALHVVGTNPLTLSGVQAGTSTTADSLLTITSGLVRKLPMSTFTSNGTSWLLGGNTVTTAKNLGTIDNNDLPFITNNTEKMRLSATGNLGIGSSSFNATNPEKLLVQAGTTTSFNLMQGHGKINNYLQLNIQNDSAGTSASSDMVATSDNGNESINYIDMGINSSANTSTGVIGGANNAYLYSTGNNFAIGNATSGKPLQFFTGGTATTNERMRIDGTGRVGVGITDPANPLVVKDTFEIRRTGSVSELLFSNTAGTGDFRIGGDGGDIFWQGGGGRNLQMGAYWGILLSGDRQTATFPSFSAGVANTGVLVQAQRDASVPLGIQANSATQTANLTEWRTSTGAVLDAVDENGYLGIGTTAPLTKLHVVGTNPLTLTGVQAGTSTTADSLLTITSGLVRKIPMTTFTSAGNSWTLGGNTVTTAKNLGTVDNNDLPFITNNTEKMRLSATGNVGVGSSTFNATNPEKLLVQAGTTSSFNLMQGHGKINNYLQINVQNDSAGTSASSDLVATSDNGNETTNYIDMGINSSANSSTGTIGGANNAYLYSTGNDFSIGNATAGKSLLFFTGGTAGSNEAMRINSSGKVGIGTTAPSTTLHVVGTNPLTLTGVQAGTSTSADSLLTITSGLVRKIPMSTFTSASNFWGLSGNTVGSLKNFGTVDAFDLPIITNNTEKMRISSTGNVAIGSSAFNATNPEKLLVQAGTTTSFNLMQGHGKINNYLQINIQNDSSGTASSSDLVATSDNGNESVNFVDLGINSSNFSNTGVLGGANNAYLYSTGNDFVIGNATPLRSLLFFTGGTTTGNERVRIDSSGKVGVATTTPQAKLDVAGTFKLGTSGTVLTNMFKTSVSITDNTNNISYPQSLTKTVTVTGAALNATVIVTPRSALANGLGIAYAYVSSANTVTINFTNSGAGLGGNQLLGTITFDITIIQ